MKQEIVTTLHYVDHEDKLIVNRTQDCEPILDQAKVIRDLTPSKEMRHVMRVPAVVVEQYCTRQGITLNEFLVNPAHIDRVLKDSDLAYFRTNPA